MAKYYPQPTIIGSGLTGLLISLALSKARIGHVLIGGPPPVGSPRLGESLNLEATMFFLEEFPHLADCYYDKQFAAVYIGDLVGKFHFSFLRDLQNRALLKLFGKQTPSSLIHFDRVRLDAAIYEHTVNSPYCSQLDVRVAEVRCLPGADTISHLTLQDGTHMPVSHVFDATGYIRLVARQLNIQRRILGIRQHVVHTHYFRDSNGAQHGADAEWRHGTNNVRLYRDVHGIDALGWCIPLGDTISVGITTADKSTLPSDEALLSCLNQAFADYGVNYAEECDDRSRLATAKMEFYTHARGYGANWLLASAANTQVWWPTSAGVDTSIAAAHAAVPFLKRPDEIGRRYQEYLAPLIRSQELWNWGANHKSNELSRERAAGFANRLIWSISLRTLLSLTLEKQDNTSQRSASLIAQIWGNEIWSRLPSPADIQDVSRIGSEEHVST